MACATSTATASALNGVSFTVNRAEIFGLLGPNGSGKTTMFRILSTLMLPAAGRALILGHDVALDPSGVRRQIGVVFQSRSIDVKLSAEENLIHVGHLYGITGSALKKRVAEMLERVSLTDRAKDRAETFSGGMQRRLELAKGLLHRPQVLLLDEPSTGLDPGARRDLWQYLQILRDQEGVSIIVTTHLMEEAEKCDRLAILSHGNLVGLGTPAQLKSEIGGDVILLDAARPAEARLADQRALCRRGRRARRWPRPHRARGRAPLHHRRGRSLPRRDRCGQRQQADAGGCLHPPHRPPLLERRCPGAGATRRRNRRRRKSTKQDWG